MPYAGESELLSAETMTEAPVDLVRRAAESSVSSITVGQNSGTSRGWVETPAGAFFVKTAGTPDPSSAVRAVVERATAPSRDARFDSVAHLAAAWQKARRSLSYPGRRCSMIECVRLRQPTRLRRFASC